MHIDETKLSWYHVRTSLRVRLVVCNGQKLSFDLEKQYPLLRVLKHKARKAGAVIPKNAPSSYVVLVFSEICFQQWYEILYFWTVLVVLGMVYLS